MTIDPVPCRHPDRPYASDYHYGELWTCGACGAVFSVMVEKWWHQERPGAALPRHPITLKMTGNHEQV